MELSSSIFLRVEVFSRIIVLLLKLFIVVLRVYLLVFVVYLYLLVYLFREQISFEENYAKKVPAKKFNEEIS